MVVPRNSGVVDFVVDAIPEAVLDVANNGPRHGEKRLLSREVNPLVFAC